MMKVEKEDARVGRAALRCASCSRGLDLGRPFGPMFWLLTCVFRFLHASPCVWEKDVSICPRSRPVLAYFFIFPRFSESTVVGASG